MKIKKEQNNIKNRITSGIVIMIIGTIITKILAFLRDILMAKQFGTSFKMDSYVIAHTIPNIFLACFGVAIANSIVSLYSNVKKEKNELEAKKMLNSTLRLMIILSVIIIIINIAFAPIVVKIIASGLSTKSLKLASELTRITTISILFISINYVLNGYLQYKNSFLLSSISGSITSLIIVLLSVFKLDSIFLYGLAWVVGELIQFIIVYLSVLKKDYKPNPFQKTNSYYRLIISVTLPLAIGYSIQQLNVIIDKKIASSLFEGAVSSLNYANTLITSLVAILITSIVTVYYSKISKIDTKEEEIKKINEVISLLSIIIIPIVFFIIFNSKEIIYFLFYGGIFDNKSLINTANPLLFYSLGLIFIAFRDVLVRVALLNKKSKIVMISNIIAVTSNILLNIILSKVMGHTGLALATSISMAISFFFLFLLVGLKDAKIDIRNQLITIIKIIVAFVVPLIILILMKNNLNISKVNLLIWLFVEFTSMIISYLIMLFLLKERTIIMFLTKLKITKSIN